MDDGRGMRDEMMIHCMCTYEEGEFTAKVRIRERCDFVDIVRHGLLAYGR